MTLFTLLCPPKPVSILMSLVYQLPVIPQKDFVTVWTIKPVNDMQLLHMIVIISTTMFCPVPKVCPSVVVVGFVNNSINMHMRPWKQGTTDNDTGFLEISVINFRFHFLYVESTKEKSYCDPPTHSSESQCSLVFKLVSCFG